jgi:HK97 gp10 family phage protein
MGISFHVEYDHLPELLDKLLKDVDHQLAESADQVRKDAQSLVHVRTGATRASIYVSSPEGSDYGDAVSQASALAPKTPMLPEEKPAGPHEAVVGVALSAGIYEEYGTRYAPAIPFLTPAAEGHKPHFEKAMSDLIDAL